MMRFVNVPGGCGVLKDGGYAPLLGVTRIEDAITSGAWPEMLARASAAEPTEPEPTKFLKPMLAPGKTICVGVNFPDRNAEYKDGVEAPPFMSLFPRFPASFVAHEEPLVRPPESEKLDYEGEMAVVIGTGGRRISPEDALDHIAGLTIVNEGTIRDWVRHAKFNVTQGKNWEASGAMGPWLVPYSEPSQVEDAGLVTRVNGEVRQEDRTSRMLFPVRQQIAYISTFMRLEPGDVIVTGTPTGAGARLDPPQFLKPGDTVEVEVEGIGILRNGVRDEA